MVVPGNKSSQYLRGQCQMWGRVWRYQGRAFNYPNNHVQRRPRQGECEM
ncbi:hypothetical protein PROFUN_06313 [Planoprotostelium fungivorum]|uniref:Uncharacterized protein n=1 Tax=Planoprotostelium fungivorum TaxID=1890364 RepID=A0A2P6NP34_9EUKA|nr:hypothetical protein PROFUN_06313 [Planoprotostelium fungivorum]